MHFVPFTLVPIANQTLFFVIAAIVTFVIPGIHLRQTWRLPHTSLGIILSMIVFALVRLLDTWLSGGSLIHPTGPISFPIFTSIWWLYHIYWCWQAGRRQKIVRSALQKSKKTILSTLRRSITSQLTTAIHNLQPHRLILLIAALLLALQFIPMMGSAWSLPIGVRFFQINMHDGVFHLSLIQALTKSIPPEQPGAAGLLVTNYHYGSHWLIAAFANWWHLSIPFLFFETIPLSLGILLLLLVYQAAMALTNSRLAATLSMVMITLAGDLTPFAALLTRQEWDVRLPAIDHGLILFHNMPQAFGKVLLFAVILLLARIYNLRARTTTITWQDHLRAALIIPLFAAAAITAKVYFGLAILVLIATFGLLQLFRRDWRAFGVWLISGVVAALLIAAVYLPVNRQAGGLFLVPLAWPKLLISPEKLNWSEWWLHMQVYQEHHNLPQLIIWQTALVIFFFVSIYGVRLLGLLALVLPVVNTSKKTNSPQIAAASHSRLTTISLILVAVLLSTIGANFLQVSGLYNTFNFFVVALHLLTIPSAMVMAATFQCAKLISKFPRPIRLIPLGISVALLVLSSVRPMFDFAYAVNRIADGRDSAVITPAEHAGIHFLQQLAATSSTPLLLQAHLFNSLERETPYLGLFSNLPVYFGGIGILKSHNQPIEQREMWAKSLFGFGPQDAQTAIRQTGITHIFLHKKPEENISKEIGILPIVYQNDEVVIFATR